MPDAASDVRSVASELKAIQVPSWEIEGLWLPPLPDVASDFVEPVLDVVPAVLLEVVPDVVVPAVVVPAVVVPAVVVPAVVVLAVVPAVVVPVTDLLISVVVFPVRSRT
jgi:hypothetical protein